MLLFYLRIIQEIINLRMSFESKNLRKLSLEKDLEWYFVMFNELLRKDEMNFETI